MKKLKVIKTKQGRVTIQKNSFGIPEIKVKYNDKTFKIRCRYQDINEIENVVEALLLSEIDDVEAITYRSSGESTKEYGI